MVYLFGNYFKKRGVTLVVSLNLKYVRNQYRVDLKNNLKNHPPMVLDKVWKALIDDAKEKVVRKQGRNPHSSTRYGAYDIFDEICLYFFLTKYFSVQVK